MASKKLFSSTPSSKAPAATARNAHGARAYAFSDKASLAKMAMTGTLGTTFYASDKAQLDQLLVFADKVSPEFLGKTAVFAAEKGFMKDVPALLTAKLAAVDTDLLAKVFPRVCRNGKMVRNFVQIIRSGKVGRKSLGTAPKRLIQNFLNGLPDKVLLNASVGDSPSLADVIKLSHPRPPDEARKAFYGYLIDKEVDKRKLPEIVKKFEAWKKNPDTDIPEVDFRLLTSAKLSDKQWKDLALAANWQTLRQGLNMFLRHNVFNDTGVTQKLAAKLVDEIQIRKANVFPFQLLAAYLNVDPGIPRVIVNALQAATEIATNNIPAYPGKVWIFPDVSGSMSQPYSGMRGDTSSKIRYIDCAALVTAAILRRNPDAEVVPFGTDIHLKEAKELNPLDSIMTNAAKLAAIKGGGTNCSLPMQYLNKIGAKGDLIIYVSDNESWMDDKGYANYISRRHFGNTQGFGTRLMDDWEAFKRRNPQARLVSIDMTPAVTSQIKDRPDILNVSGLNDVVFDVISAFHRGETQGEHLTNLIDSVQL